MRSSDAAARVAVEILVKEYIVAEVRIALLENRIARIPQRKAQAQALLVIRKSRDTVLAAAIGAAPRGVVGKVVPGIAVRAVVFANRAPLALGKIWAPLSSSLSQVRLARKDVHAPRPTSSFDTGRRRTARERMPRE
jgi:hypothetical protein